MNREPNPTLSSGKADRSRMLRLRLLILGMVLLAPISAYLTRVMSAINTTLAREYGINDIAMGSILAAFNVGYLIFQVPGGWLAQRFSVRRVFPFMAVCWSLSAIWFSMSRTSDSFYAARVALGLSQAGMVPCCALVISSWVGERFRGIYSSMIGISMQIGGVIATSLTGHLVLGTFTEPPSPMAWSDVYFIYAFTGIIFAIGFYWIYRDHPLSHPWLRSTSEKKIDSISRHDNERTAPNATSVKENANDDPSPAVSIGPRSYTAWEVVVFTVFSASMWLICLQGFFRAFAYEFFTTWFTAYLEQARGMNLEDAGNWASLPIIAFGAGPVIGGFCLDLLYRWTENKWISRSLTAVVSLGLCAIFTGIAAFVEDTRWAILFISLGAFLASIAGPCTWVACLDICGKRSAVIFGIMNSIGAVGAWLSPKVFGYLFNFVKTNNADWNYVLYLLAAVNFAGALSWIFLNPNRPIVAEDEVVVV